MSRKKSLEEVAETYRQEDYNTVALDEIYPGILTEENAPKHKAQGKIDILLQDKYIKNQYKVVEVGITDSLDTKQIESLLNRKNNQANKNREYVDQINPKYEAESETVLYATGRLRIVNELLQGTNGIFTWNEAVETVSNPGYLGNMKQDEIIRINHDVSREENKECYEVFGAENVLNLLNNQKTYP